MRQRKLIGPVVAIAASAVLGLVAGVIWNVVAPRAVLLEVSAGAAQVVNAETRAFIGADGWFCVIAAIAGLLTGIVGYRLGIARRGGAGRTAVAVGLIIGSVAGGYLMLWLGQQIGQSGYQHQLADAAVGTTFNSSLELGAKSALAFWPLLTSLVIVLGEMGGGHRGPEPGRGDGTGPVPSMWTGRRDDSGAP
jgi:hypothetical protein